MARKRVNITLDDTLYKKIQELATKDYRSASNMIEFILNEYIKGAGVFSTPAQPLYYPEGVRSPIPEEPYKITAISTTTTTTKPKKRTIIGDDTPTQSNSKKHPLVWLDENNIDPNDISEKSYTKLHEHYSDVSINDFVNYQHQRQNRYVPDPNDPFDPTLNNPYLKNKK